jgi:hypothetical protein
MTQTLTARELFRAAYDNRYTWDAEFPGYRAEVTLKIGKVTHTGQVRINSDLTFEVLGVKDEQAKHAIHNQLWEITIHRVSHSFEESHSQNTFTLGSIDETGAVEILVGGASAGNRYKVRDNTVCFVHRHIGNKIVNINTFKTLMTDKGYLAQGYDSVYIDPETGKSQGHKTTFEDSFEKIGNYYILTRRLIYTEQDGEPITTEFGFSNVKLLEPVAI